VLEGQLILTDREIQMALESSAIVINPNPAPSAYSSTTVDLTLDPKLSIFEHDLDGTSTILDPSSKNFDHEAVLSKHTKQITIGSSGYQYEPGSMILAWTKEYLELPTQGKLAARVEGKSSLARLGISIHLTAPTIHAGFRGQVRLEMMNHGRHPIILREGMKICQLIFEMTTGTPVQGYKGRFSGQKANTQHG
jgi:dCTP deaminase